MDFHGNFNNYRHILHTYNVPQMFNGEKHHKRKKKNPQTFAHYCMPKQFLGKGPAERFAICLQAVVWAGSCNLAMVPPIARLLLTKGIMVSLTSTNYCQQTGQQFHVHPKDSTHIDETPRLWNTRTTMYSLVGIQTQARQHRGVCACIPLGDPFSHIQWVHQVCYFSEFKKITCGVPQGSLGSILVFTLAHL